MKLSPNRRRPGFSMLELIIVLVIMAIAGTVAFPAIGRSLGTTTLNRSASVISVELQQARSLAGRTRKPIRVEFDGTQRVMRVRDHITPATVYSERWFNAESDMGVQQLATSPGSQVVMFPNGLASGPINVTLTRAGQQRRIAMTRAGQVRITTP